MTAPIVALRCRRCPAENPVLLRDRRGRWHVHSGCLRSGPRRWNRNDALTAWAALQRESAAA